MIAWLVAFLGSWVLCLQLAYTTAILSGDAQIRALRGSDALLRVFWHVDEHGRSGFLLFGVVFCVLASLAGALLYARRSTRSLVRQVALCALGACGAGLAWLVFCVTEEPGFVSFGMPGADEFHEAWRVLRPLQRVGPLFVAGYGLAPVIVERVDRAIERLTRPNAR